MVKVNVKLFGVLRVTAHISSEEVQAEKVIDIIDLINDQLISEYNENKIDNPQLKCPKKLTFDDVAVYINGNKTDNKKKALCEGDDVWFLSPVAVC